MVLYKITKKSHLVEQMLINFSAYLYYTNLGLDIVAINRNFGLFHNPFLNGICDVWHHWEREKYKFVLG